MSNELLFKFCLQMLLNIKKPIFDYFIYIIFLILIDGHFKRIIGN
jgi:hypothetical protein